jgi:hypothetical protein
MTIFASFFLAFLSSYCLALKVKFDRNPAKYYVKQYSKSNFTVSSIKYKSKTLFQVNIKYKILGFTFMQTLNNDGNKFLAPTKYFQTFKEAHDTILKIKPTYK